MTWGSRTLVPATDAELREVVPQTSLSTTNVSSINGTSIQDDKK